MNEDSRDWPDDFALENGNYQNHCHRCRETFLGHKRRVTCRACAAVAGNVVPEPCSTCKGTGQVFAVEYGDYMSCNACRGTKTARPPESVVLRVDELAVENHKLRTENALLKRNVITVHVVPQPCLTCKGTGQVFDAEDEEYMDCGTCHGTKTAPTPAPVILRDEVALFAVLMEARLRANDAEKGAQGWKGAPWRRLLSILRDHTTGLAAHLFDDTVLAERAEGIKREAADVANLAMMLADTQGDLFHDIGGG